MNESIFFLFGKKPEPNIAFAQGNCRAAACCLQCALWKIISHLAWWNMPKRIEFQFYASSAGIEITKSYNFSKCYSSLILAL